MHKDKANLNILEKEDYCILLKALIGDGLKKK